MNSILYIEDEEDYRILVQRILHRAGLEVTMSVTRTEGLEILRRKQPSLLLLDVNLPDANGYDLCQEIREDPSWSHLPIILVTVRRQPEEWLRGFSSGASDYIAKPLNPPELVERIRRSLERRIHSPVSGSGEFHLIRSAVAGNHPAFEVLIQKYRLRLLESIRCSARGAAQAEDIVSEAFAVAFEKLREFRGESTFYTWVYRIAMNVSIGNYRRPHHCISLEEISERSQRHLFETTADQTSPDRPLLDEQMSEYTRGVVAQLPRLYREILKLYFIKDLTYEAIAKKLNIPTGTVMSRLHKAKKLLRAVAGPLVG